MNIAPDEIRAIIRKIQRGNVTGAIRALCRLTGDKPPGEQESLFNEGSLDRFDRTDGAHPKTPPHVSGSRTSRASARQLTKHVGKIQRRILAHILALGERGATDWELERDLGLRHQTASSQRRFLVQKGYLIDGKRTRATGSGRQAIVWIPTGLEPPLVKRKPQHGGSDETGTAQQERAG